MRVDLAQPFLGQLDLRAAHVGGAEEHLPLEIAQVDPIEIDDADAADSGGRQVHSQRGAETAGSDDQGTRRAQPNLALHAHLGQREVAAVARDLLRVQLAGRSIVPRHGIPFVPHSPLFPVPLQNTRGRRRPVLPRRGMAI